MSQDFSKGKIYKTLRFAGGEGAQRRSGQRIFGTRPKSRTPKDRAFRCLSPQFRKYRPATVHKLKTLDARF